MAAGIVCPSRCVDNDNSSSSESSDEESGQFDNEAEKCQLQFHRQLITLFGEVVRYVRSMLFV